MYLFSQRNRYYNNLFLFNICECSIVVSIGDFQSLDVGSIPIIRSMCTKKKYKDKLSAMFALSQCKFVSNSNHKRKECRFYFCPICKSYHLTSKK